MAKTERGEYRFVVKESPSGKPFIVLENAGHKLDIIEPGVFGFALHEGIPLEEAVAFAFMLNTDLVRVEYTTFGDDDELAGGAEA